MKYSMTLREAIDAGIIIDSEKPIVEAVEVYHEGNVAKYRYITAPVLCSLEALEKWRVSKELKCERCGHQWISILTGDVRPRSCPVCKSPYWDRPRRSRPAEKVTPMIILHDGKTYRVEYFCRICEVSWPKDTETLNVSCPQCRRKCGASSRRVEVEDTPPTVSDEQMSVEEFQDVWKKLREETVAGNREETCTKKDY